MKSSQLTSSVSGTLLLALIALLPLSAVADDEEPLTSFLSQPISSIDGYFPTPWAGCGPNPGTQSVLQFHLNWHCNNPDNTGPNWGNRFFGFHNQFTFGFDRYRASLGFPFVQTWVAGPGAIIPPAHRGRAANTPCTTCTTLPNNFRLPAAGGTLDTFPSVSAIGSAIVGWHNTNHGRIGAQGGTDCSTTTGNFGDMTCVSQSPRDPVFYRYHNLFTDVHHAWRTHQPSDIVLVLDRSGSMSQSTTGGLTRLEAARDAAELFADLLEDGSPHRVGAVTFSTMASSPADLPLTGVAAAPGAMNTALAGISASGATSIGSGLQVAMATLGTGSNPRKAIVLLTDGLENTAPMIADVQNSLGDTHLCSVGFGEPGTLDGSKLRDLSERQGGIHISGPGALELRKFFVECFADIFDSFVGVDPIVELRSDQARSDPLVHQVAGDDKLVFVASWENGAGIEPLQWEITSPSGRVINLGDPAVENEFGRGWHIVRLRLPLDGEGDGKWVGHLVRGATGYVNGFMSDAFDDIASGAELIARQIRQLCRSDCDRVLFYEDDRMLMDGGMTFDTMLSAYSDAIYYEAGAGNIGSVTKLRHAQELAERLRRERFDLIVYSSRYAKGEQPYDAPLIALLCRERPPRMIVSDNRDSSAAEEILKCAGATRTGENDFESIKVDDTSLSLSRPSMAEDLPFSYSLSPVTESSTPLAFSPSGEAVSVARFDAAEAIRYFTTSLVRGAARVNPAVWISDVYTGEELHPTFHIPEAYWPRDGYAEVKAVVEVTRPLVSIAEIAAGHANNEPATLKGDVIPARVAAILRSGNDNQAPLIKTETIEFPLFDDGTGGDGTANDHFWEASLPPEITEFDGEYGLRAKFQLCDGNGVCVSREAQHTLDVALKLSEETTEIEVQSRDTSGEGRRRATVRVTPRDEQGRPFGPGSVDALKISTFGLTRIRSTREIAADGTLDIDVDWGRSFEEPGLSITQFGRPENNIVVPLP